MTDTEVFKGIESATMMLEELAKAFSDLESHINSSIQDKVKWDEIKEYFHSLEISLKDKLDEVKAKEKVLEEKQAVARALIAEKEAIVSAKELASLARLQELRDSAVSAIADARHKYKVESPEPIDTKVSKGQKVGTSFDDKNAPSLASKGKNPDEASGEVQPRLKELCEKMDAKGLLKYIIDTKNRTRFTSLREELPLALKYATEPASLVLESLEVFYPLDQPSSQGNQDNTLQGMRRSCLLLMESASLLFPSTEPGVNYLLSSEIKQKATEIANKWKPKLASLNLDASSSLEAQAYLQLLATFSIAPENDEDELCKLIVAVSSCRRAPEFCRSLGLAHKVPDLVEELVQKGRQIDAVRLIQSFELTDRFPPVPLLKAYLAHSKDADKSNGEKAAVTQELGALRAVIKCIEEYKLHDEYPREPLQKQVAQLEKVRANKKRTSNAAAKFQSKKYRRGGSYRAPRRYPPTADVWQRPPPPLAAADHRGAYAGGMATRRPYDVSPAYEAPVLSAYGQQVRSPRSYHYPDQRAPTAAYGSISSSFRSYSTSGLHADGGIPSAAHGSISSSYGSYPNTGFRAAPNSYANYMGTEPPRPPPPLPQQQPPSSSYGSYSGIGYQPPHQSYM
ncbi:FRIGIDA-like protein 4b [Curcuma longa]|uniref:FRIGIDA-like protein 4b n=1 Tax=Curcuma longa TaxID=136217 RepID=UPI003D9E0CFD